MAMNLAPFLKQRFFNANGIPLAGGKLYSYQSGTSTPQATYVDAGGLTPNANPVLLDANGEANVWLDAALSYKFILKDSSDVTQFTTDGVIGVLSGNSVTTSSIQNGAVTLAKMANLPASTIMGNNTLVPAAPLALTAAEARAVIGKAPTVQKFTSGSGTYTTPTNPAPLYLRVRAIGGGGGGAGTGSGGDPGVAGSNTTFGSSLIVAGGGSGGTTGGQGALGGSASLGTGPVGIAAVGGSGGGVINAVSQLGGVGGNGALGGGGGGGSPNGSGRAGAGNTGGGGGGGGGTASIAACSGGGSGGYVDAIITTPAATYPYAVGSGGVGGSGTGGAGATGQIIVEEYYS